MGYEALSKEREERLRLENEIRNLANDIADPDDPEYGHEAFGLDREEWLEMALDNVKDRLDNILRRAL